MPRIGKAFRRPPTARLRDRSGGLPRPSDGVARALRCPASPRHALLAENLGKPSLWVIISAPWYNTHRDTIMRLMVEVGGGCANLMNEEMRDLSCQRLQVDEIWSFVGKKQAQLKPV